LFPAAAYPALVGLAETLGIASLTSDLGRVEAGLKTSVQTEDPFLTDVATHLIGAGGKRLRPTLTLLMAYGAAGDAPAPEAAVTGGISVELVHLGSLYHDDVIDEADTRRGVPTVNARWGNIVAILAGDFLLARASELAASLGTEVAGLLAATIGELCKGQVLELQRLFDPERDEKDYSAAIAGKTAALLATSCRIGAIVAGFDRPTIDAVTRYGHHLGITYQIVDDVLDLTAAQHVLGKPVGKDMLEGVYTLPVILALKESAPLRELLASPVAGDRLNEARDLIVASGAADQAMTVARAEVVLAQEALAGARDLKVGVGEALGRLAEYLLDRQA
jgi:heptaprenyl diphosphate synthase